MNKKKIVLITGSFGNGHITASNALAEKFIQEKNEVKIFDIAKQTWGGKFLNILFKISPLWLTNTSYDVKNIPFPSIGDRILGKIFFGFGLEKLFRKITPDEVWCTMPLITPEINKYFSGKIFIQITDYFSPHLSWVWGNPTKIFCLDEESKKYLLEKKPSIDPNNIESVEFPLPEKIGKIKNYTTEQKQEIKQAVQEKFSLDTQFLQKKIIILFFHHILLGNEKKIIADLQTHKRFSQYFICVLAGNMTEKFSEYEEQKNIKIFPWVQGIENFYAIADSIGGKCGGAFTSEVMKLKIPLLITGKFSGQEKGNYKYLQKYYSENIIHISSQ